MNRFLSWTVILLLLVSNGHLQYKIDRLEKTVLGLTALVVLTNNDAKDFVQAVIPASQIKDDQLRGRVIRREMKSHFGTEGEDLFGYRNETSRV